MEIQGQISRSHTKQKNTFWITCTIYAEKKNKQKIRSDLFNYKLKFRCKITPSYTVRLRTIPKLMSENYILIVKNDDHKNIIQGPTDTILAM
jgi:hypothetical protein